MDKQSVVHPSDSLLVNNRKELLVCVKARVDLRRQIKKKKAIYNMILFEYHSGKGKIAGIENMSVACKAWGGARG